MQKLQSLIIALALVFACAGAEGYPAWQGEGYCDGEAPVFFDVSLIPEAPGVNILPLDALGRAAGGYALLSKDIFPKAARSSLSGKDPAGYKKTKYSFIPSGYLYNRSHLIGNLLSGNDSVENLFCGTQYLNQETMFSLEKSLYTFIDMTGYLVEYAVVPLYDGDELIPRLVYVYACSRDDDGAGFSRSLYMFNVQPGVMIDYMTGDSALSPTALN